ncbi:MAG: hypothetical protein KJZ93_20550 [Caldilineaceae bacterium]|nr:hypothetical protein [Caldilineaceae bacterium]
MKFVVDTNVIAVANHMADQASPSCRSICVRELREIERSHTVVLDDQWRILQEYKSYWRRIGQPQVGDRFVLWALRNVNNRARCELIAITPVLHSEDGNDFVEFPQDPDLANFDRSDRKFVAVTLAHPERPPILNAVDTDWWRHRSAFERCGVIIHFLCPDAIGE